MADPFGGGFLSGYNAQDQINRGKEAQNLQNMGHAQGILSNMQKMQEMQQIKAAMAGATDLKTRIDALEKIGSPMAYEVAKNVMASEGEKLKLAQGARQAQAFSPETVSRFTTQGQAAQPEEVMPEGIAGPPTPAREATPSRLDFPGWLENAATLGAPGAMTGLTALEARKATTANKMADITSRERIAQSRHQMEMNRLSTSGASKEALLAESRRYHNEQIRLSDERNAIARDSLGVRERQGDVRNDLATQAMYWRNNRVPGQALPSPLEAEALLQGVPPEHMGAVRSVLDANARGESNFTATVPSTPSDHAAVWGAPSATPTAPTPLAGFQPPAAPPPPPQNLGTMAGSPAAQGMSFDQAPAASGPNTAPSPTQAATAPVQQPVTRTYTMADAPAGLPGAEKAKWVAGKNRVEMNIEQARRVSEARQQGVERSPESIRDDAFYQFVNGRARPGSVPTGRYGEGNTYKAKIAEALHKIEVELNITSAEMASRGLENRANVVALSNNVRDLSAITPYKEMLDTNAKIAMDLGRKLVNNKTNSAFLNRPILWLQNNAANKPDIAEYLAQMHFVVLETTRVLNNPRLVGQMTVEAKRDMESVISSAMTIESTERVINRLMADGDNRINAMRDQRERILTDIRGSGRTSYAPAKPAAPYTPYTPSTGGWSIRPKQ